MRDPLTDEALVENLRGLPAERASAGFDKRVLAAYDARRSEVTRRLHPAWAAAALIVLVAGLLAGLGHHARQRNELQASRRAEDLRLQHLELQQELRSLQMLAGESAPVLYLASDQELDLVFDLSPLVDRYSTSPPGAPQVRPAVHDLGATNQP